MKYLKMLGLGAVAAAALMAFVGASSSSASVLCTTAPNAKGNCPSGWGYSGTIHAVSEAEAPTMTAGFKNITCESVTMQRPSTEGTASETPNGAVEVLTFNGCNCTVNVIEKGTLENHAIGDTGNGTVTSNGATITTSCSTIFGTVHCNYVTNNADLGTMTGGTTATLDVTTSIERESTNAICEEEAIWHAKFKITTPDSLWVATATE